MKLAGRERQPDTGWSVETDADRQFVLEQLDRLLASPVFRSSKRLSGFLRYIVEETLANGGSDLKERVIGVQVFGRAPDYDTSGEPVVRVSAGDLRKRIAQYYHEPGHDNELRIDLPTGSYHPVFHLPAAVAAASAAATLLTAAPVPVPQVAPVLSARRDTTPTVRFYSVAGLMAVLAGIAVTMLIRTPASAYEQFWGPVMDATGPVLVYVGARQDDDRMVFEDALALTDLGGTLRSRNRPYRILRAGDLTPESLKQGPSLLIGGFTNPLARRLTQQLRFTFASDGQPGTVHQAYIQDRQNLASRDWAVQVGAAPPATDLTDYAIVSRVVDPVTGQIAVVSAGIRKYGTYEAAEFLSHPEQIEALAGGAPGDWRKKDMQAVLAITVKGGKAEPARVVASYFW
jgi:hypothetical protein